MTNWFFEEEETVTETDQQLRDKEIRARLERARRLETVDAMKERYEEYGHPL